MWFKAEQEPQVVFMVVFVFVVVVVVVITMILLIFPRISRNHHSTLIRMVMNVN